MRNHIMITKFVFLGISDNLKIQAAIFIFLFIAYILSITGNLTTIILTLLGKKLKTPMYFFLRNFSFLEITFTSVSFPRFLCSVMIKVKTISYNNCLTQLFLVISLGVSEFYLLTAMSYDRYVAICKPLHYTTIKNKKICHLLVFSSHLSGFLTVFPVLMLILKLDFCASNVIDHFSCDYFPILQLSCSDTWLLETPVSYLAFVTLLFTLVLMIFSYIRILNTILRIPSATQRKKAFSTCSSHMIVISISYRSCIFIYVKPSANERESLTKGVVILNTSIAPMLNPFICMLRNQQI
ncbi:PREDICTED: olfactory receptor 6C3-like [Chinchilla lanigera]|uniref:olfactory receptor 6C3-like n=1 Tax=Chinchilla lanigera TaxID=34839 RepID=UPI0006985A65|nr:PREDICTED: olfactory receptor 6C3-like [Chinchilla lanigera]